MPQRTFTRVSDGVHFRGILTFGISDATSVGREFNVWYIQDQGQLMKLSKQGDCYLDAQGRTYRHQLETASKAH